MFNDIFFINTKALANKLARNEISEKVALWHFMIQAIILGSSMTVQISIECGEQDGYSIPLTLFGMAISGAIIYWGLSSLFKVNSNIDGVNFFTRYAALSLPSGIQVFIAMLIFSAFFGLIAGTTNSFFGNDIPVIFWLFIGELINILLVFLFFRIMLSSFQEIAIQKQNQAN